MLMAHPFIEQLISQPIYLAVAFAAVIWFYNAYGSRSKRLYNVIPSIGCGNDFYSSWKAAYRFKHDAKAIIQEGYEKHKGGMFKIALTDRWMIMVTGRDLIEQMRKATEDQLNFHGAVEELTKSKFSFGPAVTKNPYHVDVIRTQLNRNIPALFPELLDELAISMREALPPSSDWVACAPLPLIQRVVCRASNRIFVGLPKCRDLDYISLNIGYTLDVMYARKTLSSFPKILQPIAGRFITNIKSRTRQAIKHLKPMIEERLSLLEQNKGDFSDLPNDMLTWLIAGIDEKGRTVLELSRRILIVNFAAIHTSSSSFVHVLFHIAAHPEWLGPLRQEIEDITREHGWTKLAINKMRRLDSILRESLRMEGVNLWSLQRKAMAEFTFSNGVTVPKGALLSAPTFALHTDEENQPLAYSGQKPLHIFDPWRFSELRGEEGEETKYQFVSTSWDYLAFGHGKMACPGRFFAGSELKLMLAHFVITYDVKLEKEGIRPPNVYNGHTCSPNQQARVMLRKRSDA